MPLYEYDCPDCGLFEAMFKMDERKDKIKCSCGKWAKYKISAPRTKLDGCDPSFPGEYMKWKKRREGKMKVERQKMTDHGTYT